MNRNAKYALIAVLILGLGFGGSELLVLLKREPKKEEAAEHKRSVVVQVAKPEMVKLSVPSQGMVQPVTRTRLTSEVAGRVIEVSPKLKAGVEVTEGEVLMVVDPINYQSALAQAKAALADARMALVNEEARAEQSLRDWERLGEGGEPNPLVLRQPQLASAEARVASAAAAVDKAEADLERTRVVAPYDGVIEARMVDVGAFVTMGTPIADLYASGTFEVRLPLSVREARFVAPIGKGKPVMAALRPARAEGAAEWQAEVVRTEGQVDPVTRSIFLVAEISGSQASAEGVRVLPNLFVSAEIEGREFTNVFRVPRRSIYGDNEVLLVNSDGQLELREVNVLWEDPMDVVVDSGLQAGEQICVTTFSDVIEGTPVRVVADSPAAVDAE
ncbi:efflux RND transporter periplasmic adaptor subunit [Sulfuriroseicoccus oceanibius]|uniref:Efflux RND transporter periplasmic adaptor subunit n=1 Tax=Sulfuriroseicoccus oceanibius TaxID=2707525 RepID=A0A6B3L8W3_9BACT|nr:efflux RND transporter periplasmic adaptor subunit [Sulfuriroseicoccus oceanibius]QQL43908.1 efflux RND transporter periplasmic adaptor subunit [Sulfuriroseicoccus oceanibius]